MKHPFAPGTIDSHITPRRRVVRAIYSGLKTALKEFLAILQLVLVLLAAVLTGLVTYGHFMGIL